MKIDDVIKFLETPEGQELLERAFYYEPEKSDCLLYCLRQLDYHQTKEECDVLVKKIIDLGFECVGEVRFFGPKGYLVGSGNTILEKLEDAYRQASSQRKISLKVLSYVVKEVKND